ncbi:type 1 glutamine amidotransferase domain-containing protein [Pollutibacter soli]|uniref:type 1 glutamine amidotransferase domain-containing protein n=1 Tax=Pollutibacter soli TaxID=3034157 RepID=UPI003013A017
MSAIRTLIIATSHDILGDTKVKTGAWLEEISIPYYAFRDAGADIVISSPRGGRVPLDPKSQSVILSNYGTKKFMKDDEAMSLMSASRKLEEINANDFDLVLVTGGHGAMWDLADNAILNLLLESFYSQGKVIGALCHGVAGLMSLKNVKGEALIKGKKLTCFSNSEEGSVGLCATVPFLLESRLHSLGGIYSKQENYTSHVVADGNIITGQNSASSIVVVEKMLTRFKSNRITQGIGHIIQE